MIISDLNIILPEIMLSVYAMLALVGAVYTAKDELATTLCWLTSILFAIVAFLISSESVSAQTAFNGMFIDDGFARFAKVVILLSAAAVLVMSVDYMRRRNLMKFEYPILIVLSVVGMMMMVSSGNLMSLYMGLELQSLSLYVVASFRRDSVKSTEAGMKYFVLGALSSGLLLYGASLVYGYTGSTDFATIIQAAGHGGSIGLMIGLVLVIAGLAFKVSAVPFHMWTPDVYEGSPTPVTAFFATAPKVAAMALFARVMHDAFGNAKADWQQVIVLISLLSMFLGAVAAIGQTNIKRLMAYSSIAHMGYALMGLAAGTAYGVEAMLMYMTFYAIMNIGTFAFIMTMEKGGQPVTDIQSLNLLAKTKPGKALAVMVLMVSLAGIPGTIGFFGKLYVLQAAYGAGLLWLAIAGVIASVIGAYYYLRIIYLMWFGSEQDEALDDYSTPMLTAFVSVSAIATVVGIVNFFGLKGAAIAAAAALVQ
ncbi:MAG: NADH-quinone oxidoreductase subunit NuoN [Rhodobacteraceae bacterium]|nr:NADH-quinone oxidoreductase subunit NuoN [Paracoccaceae bacterium]